MLFHSFTHLRSHNALPISKNIEDILSPNSRKRRKENSAMQSSSAVVPNKYQSPVKRTRGYLLVNYIHTLTYLLTYLPTANSFDRGGSIAVASPVTRSKSPSTSLFSLVTKSVKK